VAPAGLKIAAVARQLGVSRSWASREANAPGTRILIADIFELRRERMDALCDQALDVIEDAMNAARQFIKGAQITCLRSNWNYGRFVEPPRTFLAGVGETNMSQQLGG
jgi:hypothetical protein